MIASTASAAPSHPGRRSDPTWPWIVVWVSAVAMVVVDLAVVWEWVSDQPYHYDYWLESSVAGLAFALVGALITSRVPGNVIGPLMLVVLPLGVVQDTSGVLAYVSLTNGWGEAVVTLAGAVFIGAQTATVVTGFLVLFLVPDGRPLNRFWRAVIAWFVVLGAVSIVSSFLLGPMPVAPADPRDQGPLPGFPVGLSLLPDSVLSTAVQVNTIALFAMVGVFLLVVAQLVHRLMVSAPADRRRTGWAIAGAIAAPTGIVIFSSVDVPTIYGGSVLWAVSLSLFPLGVLIAVSRGGLYGLDRIVSRTVSYAIVTGLVLATYAVIVTAASSLFGESSTLAVAGATLAAAALVRPAIARVQRAVDRRFDREKVDAQREVDTFGTHLSIAVDAERTTAELVAVTRRTLAPEFVALWTVQR